MTSVLGDAMNMYTVIHTTWQYVCDYNSGRTRL